MIIVTGASGTLGRVVVAQLRTHHVPFRAAYTTPERAAAARADGIDAVVADYRRPDTLRAAFAGCERVFLLGPNTPDQTALELAAVAAAAELGVRHVVKQSVMGAEADDYSLAHVHRPVECALEQSAMAWTFLRPNSFMQNVLTFMATTIRERDAFYSATEGVAISHVDVRDLAEVAVAALTRPGHERRAYTLTGGAAIGYDAVAELLSRATGRTIRHVAIPPEALKGALVADGLPESLADRMLDLERYFREGRAAPVTDDVERITGHAPRGFAAYATEVAPLLAR